jgi:hypothetical protein
MTRLISVLFLSGMSIFSWGQVESHQGRVDWSRSLSSFSEQPADVGTVYLLSGAATSVTIVSLEPFRAEVELVQGQWLDEASLIGHSVKLRFEGQGWEGILREKRPRSGAEAMIYPYRRLQVAAMAVAGGFRVIAVPLLY